jgi:hypothetical protein
MERVSYQSSSVVTWITIIALVLLVLLKGAFAYLLIGDRGQPGWDYRPVPDVPGESPSASLPTTCAGRERALG